MNSYDIKKFAASLGLKCTGIAPADLKGPAEEADICPLAAGEGQDRYAPERLLPGCRSVIVILFPYYVSEDTAANLAMYCRCPDYHLVIRTYLHRIESFLQELWPESRQYSIIDTSPLADRWLAYKAGLGFFGDNHCFINVTYGSYCFIGSILTTLRLEPDLPLEKECLHCGACKTACPGHCFTSASGYDYRFCKSFLTQKKGSLTPPEITVLQKTPLIFGCDECQQVCPHNANIADTPLPEFRQDRLSLLHRSDIADMSNRQFQTAYSRRAFAWRGKKLLLRNLDYISKTASETFED
ncbi:epoxyqueuosine reductase [Megasphaera cerevisiae]|uniref:epoxyqueuosine reductase n=1 Tax=Megasphaera cerevisiae TaxID=39029 RepID=UPI000943F0FF|nr:QueG-associated DUF1730 domain-containing protein [Megasphaera cerevisiae]OKY52972.1 (Fe-S)-binding protein [Megasphaera cerevisiae]